MLTYLIVGLFLALLILGANEIYQLGNTVNALANAISATSLAASTATNFVIDLTGVGTTGIGSSTTGKLGALIYVGLISSGTIATTNGLSIQAFYGHGTTPTWDTVPFFSLPLTTTSVQQYTSFPVNGPCRIKVVLTNLDATNAITGVSAGYDTTDSMVSNP